MPPLLDLCPKAIQQIFLLQSVKYSRHCESYQFTAVTLMQFLGMICLQEELNVALLHIKDVSSRQREVQKRIELLQSENTKDIISVPHRYD